MFSFEAPFNSVSFGDISTNIAYECYKRGISPNIFPIHNNVDLTCFDKFDDSFKLWLKSCIDKAPKFFGKQDSSLRLWHINGSHARVSDKSTLLTFHELDQLTDTEINILNSYDNILVTSNYSKDVFVNSGVTAKIEVIHLGVDSYHFRNLNKKIYSDDIIVFGIFGKAEKRKNHIKTIRTWCKIFANNFKYRLHLHISNPFMKLEEMNAFYGECFNYQPKPENVIIYPYQQTRSQLNECFNAINIIIDMSGGESLSLPTLNCLALGKHVIAHNCHVLSDYCNKDNSVLVDPAAMYPCYDNKFFIPNTPFNQGNFYDYDEQNLINAFDLALERKNKFPINEEGKKVREEYNYNNGLDSIIKVLRS